jgi:hypothetical protein
MKKVWALMFIFLLVASAAYPQTFKAQLLDGAGADLGTQANPVIVEMQGPINVGGDGLEPMIWSDAGEFLYIGANGDANNAVFANNDASVTFMNSSDSATGYTVNIRQESSSPDDADVPAILNFQGWNSAGEDTIFAQLYVISDDVTNGEEDGTLYLKIMEGGSLSSPIDLSQAGGAAETNSLETTITGIADTEIFVGNGADSGTFVTVSGDASLANTGALTITSDAIEESMLKAVNSATDEYCMTYESTTGDFEWQVCSSAETNSLETTITGVEDTEIFVGTGSNTGAFVVMSGDATLANTGALTIASDAIEEAMLKAVNSPTDEYCMTYESTTGDFEWQVCGSAETNSLETTITGIEDTEILVGTGSNTASFVVMSGDATLSNAGALTIASDAIEEAMLKAVNSPTDEYCMTYESTTGDFEWQSCGIEAETNSLETTITGIADTEIFVGDGNDSGAFVTVSGDASLANTGALTIASDAIEESMLKAVDAAADEECLTYESTTGDFEWQSCGSVAGAETMMTFVISGGGSAVDAGVTDPVICQRVETDFALSAWYIYSDQDGDIVLDIWKDVWANYPPTNTDSIAGTEKPTLSSADTASDTSLGSMTTDWNTGDVVCVEIESAATLTWAVVDFIGTPD